MIFILLHYLLSFVTVASSAHQRFLCRVISSSAAISVPHNVRVRRDCGPPGGGGGPSLGDRPPGGGGGPSSLGWGRTRGGRVHGLTPDVHRMQLQTSTPTMPSRRSRQNQRAHQTGSAYPKAYSSPEPLPPAPPNEVGGHQRSVVHRSCASPSQTVPTAVAVRGACQQGHQLRLKIGWTAPENRLAFGHSHRCCIGL